MGPDNLAGEELQFFRDQHFAEFRISGSVCFCTELCRVLLEEYGVGRNVCPDRWMRVVPY